MKWRPSDAFRMLDAIDWQRPWLAPVRDLAQPAPAAGNWVDAFNVAATERRLCNHQGLPIRFVSQEALSPGESYEAFISATGQVPTRMNLHDFFNALVWLAFPAAKAQLNAMQAAEIAARAQVQPGSDMIAGAGEGRLATGSTSRGKLRDRVTIFDENAAVLLSADSGREAHLRNHRWQAALFEDRAAFGRSCELQLFGHALLEKLVKPYKAITAHVWILRLPQGYAAANWPQRRAMLDGLLSDALQQGLLETPSTPLPVLGVPGWWPHQDAAFYADATVFRPKRGK